MRTKTIRKRRGTMSRVFGRGDEVAVIRVLRRYDDPIDCLIDREDKEKVQRRSWFYHNGYCTTLEARKQWPLSWVLIGKPERGYVYHHLNGDITDNRKCNLRLITRSVKNALKSGRPSRSTGIRGVSQYASGSIVAVIGPRGKRKSFRTLEEAIRARKRYEDQLKRLFQYLRNKRP